MNIVGKWKQNTYYLERLLGKGSFALVYKVYDSQGRNLALKMSEELLSITNEYNSLKEFESMAFVPNVYDFDDWEHRGKTWHFIVMDYVQGQNLKEVIISKDLGVREAFKIGMGLLLIMGEIYKYGYKYTDIKLENIILDRYGAIHLIDHGSLVKIDKPTREYTQAYNSNSWGTGYKYDLDRSIIFSISMIIINLINQVEFNPMVSNLADVIKTINKSGLRKGEKVLLKRGLEGDFKSLDEYKTSLKKLITREKKGKGLDKIDYMLIVSLVSFVFICLWGIKVFFID